MYIYMPAPTRIEGLGFRFGVVFIESLSQPEQGFRV